MTWIQGLILVGAALGAGVLNSVAGGGTFLTFPALLFAGVDPIRANTTSTVSVWPGNIAATLAYRGQLKNQRQMLLEMSLASLVGGGVGAVVLMLTPVATFTRLIPALLLAATLLFTFNDKLLALLRRRTSQRGEAAPLHPRATLLLQFLIGTYGGYFGAGMGILMLALFSLMKFENIHQMNALKMLLAVTANAVAIAVFMAASAIDWEKGLLMAGGAIAGGYVGAAVAQKLDPRWVRRFVIATAWSMTAYFFWKTY